MMRGWTVLMFKRKHHGNETSLNGDNTSKYCHMLKYPEEEKKKRLNVRLLILQRVTWSVSHVCLLVFCLTAHQHYLGK